MQHIIADKARLQNYCALQAVRKQIEEAEAKHDTQRVEELRKSFAALMQSVDPNYRKQLDRFTQAVDQNNAGEAHAIATSLGALDKQCAAAL